MDAVVVEQFCSVVKKKDRVFYVGDFAMNYRFVEKYFPNLPGCWHWFRGNHDMGWWNRFVREHGEKLEGWWDLRSFKFHGQRIVLSHYPLVSWESSNRGAWHVHGHSHGLTRRHGKLRCDVGVDCWGFRPVSFDELSCYMSSVPVSAYSREADRNDTGEEGTDGACGR